MELDYFGPSDKDTPDPDSCVTRREFKTESMRQLQETMESTKRINQAISAGASDIISPMMKESHYA